MTANKKPSRLTLAVISVACLCAPLLFVTQVETWFQVCASGFPDPDSSSCSDTDWVYFGGGVAVAINAICNDGINQPSASCVLSATGGCGFPTFFQARAGNISENGVTCYASATSTGRGPLGVLGTQNMCDGSRLTVPWTGGPFC